MLSLKKIEGVQLPLSVGVSPQGFGESKWKINVSMWSVCPRKTGHSCSVLLLTKSTERQPARMFFTKSKNYWIRATDLAWIHFLVYGNLSQIINGDLKIAAIGTVSHSTIAYANCLRLLIFFGLLGHGSDQRWSGRAAKFVIRNRLACVRLNSIASSLTLHSRKFWENLTLSGA